MAINKNEKYITFEALQQHAKNTIKKTREHDAGVVGGYNGSFPLTTATKGNIYLLPSTQKYYVCITDYNGSQLTVPNANFEELSVYANRSKLDNLFKRGYIGFSQSFVNSGCAYYAQNNSIIIAAYIDIWNNNGINAGTELFIIPTILERSANFDNTHIDAYVTSDNSRVKLNVSNNVVTSPSVISKEKGSLFINLFVRF